MATVPGRSGKTLDATELTDHRRFARFVLGCPSILGALIAVLLVATARAVVGSFGVADLLVVMALAALTGPVEWVVHRHLFHAPPDSVRQRRLRLGLGHLRHHQDPADLHWLLLGSGGMASFALVLAAIAAPVGIATAAVVGTSALGPVLTGAAAAWAALVNYEVSHLYFHTRLRPRSARLRRLRANHLAHHHRSPDARFGVSTTVGDRLFGP